MSVPLNDLAGMSALAYQSPAQVRAAWQNRKAGHPLRHVAEEPQHVRSAQYDAQAYALKMDSGSLVLACKGTSSLEDAWMDMNVALVPFLDAKGEQTAQAWVHRGFYDQFKALRPLLDGMYEGHLAQGRSLVCTGHSLGSAVATLAALYYGERYPNQVSYFGFGTPRVGNGRFADFFDRTVPDAKRVVNGRDPVNKLPPPVEYRHVSQEMHIGRADPYANIPVLTDLPDHDITKGYIADLVEERPSQKNPLPEAHANWIEREIYYLMTSLGYNPV